MFLLIHELVGNFDLQKQARRVDLVRRTRLFVLAGLHQIRAVAGTIQRDFALLAAALRADAAMNCRTKAFLLTNLADGATQSETLCSVEALRTSQSVAGRLQIQKQPVACGKAMRFHPRWKIDELCRDNLVTKPVPGNRPIVVIECVASPLKMASCACANGKTRVKYGVFHRPVGIR